MKLAVNISLAVQMLAFAEGLLLAERSGLDTKHALDVMAGSSIGSPMLKARATLVLDPPKEAWFDLRLVCQDIELALEATDALHIPLPTAERIDEILTTARRLGYDRCDLAALFPILEAIADQPVAAA